MSLLGFFSKKDKIPLSVSDASSAITQQLDSARSKYSSKESFEDALASSNVLLFIHGFICYFVTKHGLKRPEQIWAVNVLTLEGSFGRELGTRLILALQRALHEAENSRWIDEGGNAARFFDKEKMKLLAAFLEGAAR